MFTTGGTVGPAEEIIDGPFLLPFQLLLQGRYFLRRHRCFCCQKFQNQNRFRHSSGESLELGPTRTEAVKLKTIAKILYMVCAFCGHFQAKVSQITQY